MVVGGGVDTAVLAEDAVVSDDDSSGDVSRLDLRVLGAESDAGSGIEGAAVSDSERAVEMDGREEHAPLSQSDLSSQDAVWTDLDIVCELHLIVNNRGWVDFWHAGSLGRVRMIVCD